MNEIQKNKKNFYNMIFNLICVIVIIWLAFTFILGVMMAPDNNMEPRISSGDLLVYYRINLETFSKDVILFEKTDKTGNKTKYLGRVVAMSGDVIDSTDEGITINGHAADDNTQVWERKGYQKYPIKLRNNEFFVLADNKENGEDSRSFGPVKQDEIKGKVIGQFRRDGI